MSLRRGHYRLRRTSVKTGADPGLGAIVAEDSRVLTLNRRSVREAQIAVCRDAILRGALASSELASRSGPSRVARVSVAAPLWATPLATVYFRTEMEAQAWARSLAASLRPRSFHTQTIGWRFHLDAATIIRRNPAATLSRWRSVGGPVLAIIEPASPAQLHPRAASGPHRGTPAHPRHWGYRAIRADPLDAFAAQAATAVEPIGPRWLIVTIEWIRRERHGDICLSLKGERTVTEAVLLVGGAHGLGPLPEAGDTVAVHANPRDWPHGRRRLPIDGFAAVGTCDEGSDPGVGED